MTDDNKKRGPGRPTEKRKDTILRLRIDTDTHRKLSECAAVRQVSMSELVREAIDEIFRREKEKQQKNERPAGDAYRIRILLSGRTSQSG